MAWIDLWAVRDDGWSFLRIQRGCKCVHGSGLMAFCSKSGKTTERGYGDNQKLRPNLSDIHFLCDLDQVISPIHKTKSLGFIKELSRIKCSLGSANVLGALQTLSLLTLTQTPWVRDSYLPVYRWKHSSSEGYSHLFKVTQWVDGAGILSPGVLPLSPCK